MNRACSVTSITDVHINGWPSEKTLFGLFDRKNDSRFYKSFRWAFLSNNEKTIPVWKKLEDGGSVYFTPDPAKGQVEGKEKFALGDTAVYYTVEKQDLKRKVWK